MFKVVIFQLFSKILGDRFTVMLEFYHLQFRRRTETANESIYTNIKGKDLPQQAEVAQGVPIRLRPQIFLTFDTTRVIGSQP